MLKGNVYFSLQGSVDQGGQSRLNLMCIYGWELAEILPTFWTISHQALNWKASHLRTGLALLLIIYFTQARLLSPLCCGVFA